MSLALRVAGSLTASLLLMLALASVALAGEPDGSLTGTADATIQLGVEIGASTETDVEDTNSCVDCEDDQATNIDSDLDLTADLEADAELVTDVGIVTDDEDGETQSDVDAATDVAVTVTGDESAGDTDADVTADVTLDADADLVIDLGSNHGCGCHGSDGLDVDLGTDVDVTLDADADLVIDLGSNHGCGCHGSDGLDVDLGTDVDVTLDADADLGSDGEGAKPAAGSDPDSGGTDAVSPGVDVSPGSAVAEGDNVAPKVAARVNAAEKRGAQLAGGSLPDTAMGLPGADPIGGPLLIGLAGLAVWRRLVATVR